MNYRRLGKTNDTISEVSFGTWAIGGDWGNVQTDDAVKALNHAIDKGVNFFDTADVYGGGRSEEIIGDVLQKRSERIYVATKFCRNGDIDDPKTYSYDRVKEYAIASLKRLKQETIDLYQIHCPPTEILKQGEVFHTLDRLKDEGIIRNYGVSVESVEEGHICMEHPNVATLQIIFNIFRQKPLESLLSEAANKNVGIIVRLPLASGLLTGKFTKNTTFSENDHRHFNRDGQAFNVGETFAGIPFQEAVELSDKLKWIAEGRESMTQAALRWILDQPEVSCVIPGFKNIEQVDGNLKALSTPSFTDSEMEKLKQFYQDEIAHRIRGKY
ncbi:aldo/keto reductase [Halalkalibacter urbisdiaboli]|uniref:aldo/keto reductase n=1 Tax=Halalkalibacter urbisdiaboli TaxID=1960589 RepID=UPI000B435F6C|nr:aldo/keto reductase [Halalkalibacter urbisdiaboli]